MPSVSELSLLPVYRFAPALTDYIVCEIQPNAKGGSPQAVLVPLALVSSGATPGGPSGSVQFNSSGSLSGDAGFTYAGNGQVTHALGTITANANALTITGTWNNAAVTFDAPLFMNIVNTASNAASLLMDLQVGGATKASIREDGMLNINQGVYAANWLTLDGSNSPGAGVMSIRSGEVAINGNVDFEFNPSFGSSPDIVISRQGTGLLGLQASGNPATFRVYNTNDNAFTPTNYERFVIDWTTSANVATIGTQKGGTGTARDLALTAASGNINILAGSTLNIQQGTLTANAKGLNVTATWNASGVTFDAPIFANITNTASAAGSKLVDLQVGGNSVFSLTFTTLNSGVISLSPGTGNCGIADFDNNNALSLNSGNVQRVAMARSDFFMIGTSAAYMWGTTASYSVDTTLYRQQAAGIVALINGTVTNPTALRVYNTTDAATGAPTNYERLVLDFGITTTNVATIGTQKGGTGTLREVALLSASGTYFSQNGTVQWTIFNGFLHGGAGTLSFGAGSSIGAVGTAQSTLWQTAAKVMAFGDGSQNANGWLNWGGEARATSTTSWTSNTTFSNITGLSVNVQAGRTYAIDVYIPITAGANAGGFQSALGGTCTITSLIIAGFLFDESATGVLGGSATAFSTRVAHGATTSATATVRMWGTLTVNAAGTLTVQGAQSASNATTTTSGVGARMIVHDMP